MAGSSILAFVAHRKCPCLKKKKRSGRSGKHQSAETDAARFHSPQNVFLRDCKPIQGEEKRKTGGGGGGVDETVQTPRNCMKRLFNTDETPS